jgi:hypothetical protein
MKKTIFAAFLEKLDFNKNEKYNFGPIVDVQFNWFWKDELIRFKDLLDNSVIFFFFSERQHQYDFIFIFRKTTLIRFSFYFCKEDVNKILFSFSERRHLRIY